MVLNILNSDLPSNESEITKSKKSLGKLKTGIAIAGIVSSIITTNLPAYASIDNSLPLNPDTSPSISEQNNLVQTKLEALRLQLENKTVTVGTHKENLDVAPTTINGRTMLPLRFIGEKLGLKVERDQPTQTITLTKEGKKIVMKLGDKNAIVDGKTITLDTPPVTRNGRTLVPARFIAEATGAKVERNEKTKEVTITPAGAEELPVSTTPPVVPPVTPPVVPPVTPPVNPEIPSNVEQLPPLDICLDNKNIVGYKLSGETGFESNKEGLKTLLDMINSKGLFEQIAKNTKKAEIDKRDNYNILINGEKVNTNNNFCQGIIDGERAAYFPINDLCEKYDYEYGYITINYKTSSGKIIPIRMASFETKAINRNYRYALDSGVAPDDKMRNIIIEGCEGTFIYGAGCTDGTFEEKPRNAKNYSEAGVSGSAEIDPRSVVFKNNQMYFRHNGKEVDRTFFRDRTEQNTNNGKNMTSRSGDLLNGSYHNSVGYNHD